MNKYEYIILGAGPAGLQMAYYLNQAGRDYLILERNAQPGSFFQHQRRHRMPIPLT